MEKIFKRITLTQKQLYEFSFILLSLWFVYQIPYVNLFVSPLILFLIIYLTAVVIFHLSPRASILIGLITICISIPWILIGSRQHVEPLGEAAFAILTLGFLQEAIKLRNEK